ncbi:MAG: DUF655 domain-containing protein [Sphaerospermopsis sp. SIO1G2]|nr:DUF655 domain-containing protein [Sphaerospermopsis sp. SIO1G2]
MTTPSSIRYPISKQINLNLASQAELESLPGIGEKLAQRIITTRQKQKFKSWQDVEKIPGISYNTINEWQERATFN